MQLQTERLIIRDLIPSDWTAIHTYTAMPEVTTYTAWGPNTEEDTQQYIQQVIDWQNEQPRQHYELGICLQSDGTLIGGVGIHIQSTNAEMGYVLHPDYQGSGYVTEAAQALLGYAFDTLSIHRVYATCRPANIASEKVMQKLGMTREGMLRQHWHYKGEFHDSYLYSILANEYAARSIGRI